MKESMFRVYWTHTLDVEKCYSVSHFRDFDQSDLNACISFMEMLRTDRKAGAGYSFIGMVSENPDQVGEMGVSSIENGMCPDGIQYNWKKRRI